MRQFLRFKHFILLSILASTVAFVSCDKDMNVSLGSPNEDFAVSIVDTMTVNTSTFQLNYLPSAATGIVLVGKANQPEIGSIQSSSYFRLQFDGTTSTIPTDAVYDSVNVVLRPHNSRYFYGDTTKNQLLSVHRVTQEIANQNILSDIDNYKTPIYVTGATIFSNKKFNYDQVALGTASFNPKVNSLDSISIRLDQAFGKDLFDKVVQNDYTVSNTEFFQNYLKGLVIVPDANNSVLLGLKDTIEVNLNYTYTGSDGFKNTGKKTLVTSARNYQYNNIEYDRSGTLYASLNETNRELKSSQTEQKVFIQSGSGVVAKIDIPSLNEFMSDQNIAVNKAELIVETITPNIGYYNAPSSLMLLVAKNNVPVSYIPVPFGNTVQQVNYITGNNVGVNGRYVFNLLNYVKNINTDAYRNASLLISSAFPQSTGAVASILNSANAAFIATENGKPKIKLNIVYTKFK